MTPFRIPTFDKLRELRNSIFKFYKQFSKFAF